MNVSRGSKILALTLVIAACATPGTAQQSAPAELKWTPHRAASGAADVPAAESRPAAEEPAASPAPAVVTAPTVVTAPAARPAASTVVLPEGVPAVPRSTAAATPPTTRQPLPPQVTAGRAPLAAPAFPRSFAAEGAAALFGSGLMRSPQGDVSRAILAPEGRQAVAMQRRTEARSAAAAGRLGGGLAPRFDPATTGRPRPERLAMNVDALPSVMLQQPQADVLEAAPAPQRQAPEAAAETLPVPADGVPSGRPEAGGRIVERMPLEDGGYGGDWEGAPAGGDAGLLLGEYPSEMHVESFYDDPYECEDEDCLPFCHHGLVCDWLRRFGRPYYGWRWYRDLTASAGVTAFTNETDLGINGNFGTNEYLNWAMPFWNAFGIGWQVGWRGVQTNFQPVTVGGIVDKNARDQNFVTTGFFTRAFEGRGLQFGAVYDYLSDSWFDNTDVSQLRAEISYVWGYHEAGFWSATNIGDQVGIFGPITPATGTASTIDQYCGFYRLQFGDANEWKVWGGGTGDGHGIVGSMMRAPLARSWALEGTFTYVIPGNTRTIDIDADGTDVEFAPSAWNVGVNIVFYPAGRSRRSLASPYRPLFEVADNGSMIRTITP